MGSKGSKPLNNKRLQNSKYLNAQTALAGVFVQISKYEPSRFIKINKVNLTESDWKMVIH